MRAKLKPPPFPNHRVRWTDCGDVSDTADCWPHGYDPVALPVDQVIRANLARGTRSSAVYDWTDECVYDDWADEE